MILQNNIYSMSEVHDLEAQFKINPGKINFKMSELDFSMGDFEIDLKEKPKSKVIAEIYDPNHRTEQSSPIF